MRRAAVSIAILLALPALVACGKDDPVTDDATATTATPAGGASAATTAATATVPASSAKPDVPARSARDGCRAVPVPEPATDPNRRKSRQRLGPGRTHFVVLRTNCGTIRIRLAAQAWPKTTSAFAGLVRSKFFDGLTFHRIAKPGGNDYVIQGGDPLGTGNGGPGYSLFETPPSTTTYPRYAVAMAKAQDERAGTSGSQFFIVTAKEGAQLSPEYAVLGRVSGGQDVVRRIARLAADPATEMPVDPVVIDTARLQSSPRAG